MAVLVLVAVERIYWIFVVGGIIGMNLWKWIVDMICEQTIVRKGSSSHFPHCRRIISPFWKDIIGGSIGISLLVWIFDSLREIRKGSFHFRDIQKSSFEFWGNLIDLTIGMYPYEWILNIREKNILRKEREMNAAYKKQHQQQQRHYFLL